MPRTERLNADNPADIMRAAQILREGGTVAFPTETVYGLGANALDSAAVERIFLAKQRPHWDPLIVHLAGPEMLPKVAEVNSRVAQQLIERFWPGPLTLLLPRTEQIPSIVTAGRPLVGVRIPNHAVALELIRQAGVPIAAPSANTFGHTSPTTSAHVLADLDGRIDAVLDGGPTEVGLESTVAEVVHDGVMIYRPGGADLEPDFSTDPPLDLGWVRAFQVPAESAMPQSLPSPGVGIRHYAPSAKLILVTMDPNIRSRSEDLLAGEIDRATSEMSRVGVLLPTGWNPSAAELIFAWGPWQDHEILARRLYDGLRTLDDGGATVIVCAVPEGHGIADAIRDRLQKASRTS